jgi:hypothetical protein
MQSGNSVRTDNIAGMDHTSTKLWVRLEQAHSHNRVRRNTGPYRIADEIEHSPREATDCFEHRVRDFADDLRWPQRIKWALGGVADNRSFVEPIAVSLFHRGDVSDLKSATSGLRYQSSRCI